MAFNWFKKQEEANQKAKAPVVKAVKKEKATPVATEPAGFESQPGAVKKNHSAFKILLHPIVTEKTTYLEGDSQYCFEVSPRANKIEIRKAIEGSFGVHVESVRIVNSKGKQVRYGRMSGSRKNRKKAIVTVKKGERIELHRQV